ncbi:MAG: hypothetical protein SGPRY_007069, partial [Prymnesium sp.]
LEASLEKLERVDYQPSDEDGSEGPSFLVHTNSAPAVLSVGPPSICPEDELYDEPAVYVPGEDGRGEGALRNASQRTARFDSYPRSGSPRRVTLAVGTAASKAQTATRKQAGSQGLALSAQGIRKSHFSLSPTATLNTDICGPAVWPSPPHLIRTRTESPQQRVKAQLGADVLNTRSCGRSVGEIVRAFSEEGGGGGVACDGGRPAGLPCTTAEKADEPARWMRQSPAAESSRPTRPPPS